MGALTDWVWYYDMELFWNIYSLTGLQEWIGSSLMISLIISYSILLGIDITSKSILTMMALDFDSHTKLLHQSRARYFTCFYNHNFEVSFDKLTFTESHNKTHLA